MTRRQCDHGDIVEGLGIWNRVWVMGLAFMLSGVWAGCSKKQSQGAAASGGASMPAKAAMAPSGGDMMARSGAMSAMAGPSGTTAGAPDNRQSGMAALPRLGAGATTTAGMQPSVSAGRPATGDSGRPAVQPTKDESDLAVAGKTQIDHSACFSSYRSGSKFYRAKQYANAVEVFAQYLSGGCNGRMTPVTDAWLGYRAFLSSCETPTHKYLNAFKRVVRRACLKYRGHAPCGKALTCPGASSKVTARHCKELYDAGTAAFKQQTWAEALKQFAEYESTGCYGKLTLSTDLWAAYRGVMAARNTSASVEPHLTRLKQACAKRSSAWVCTKILENH